MDNFMIDLELVGVVKKSIALNFRCFCEGIESSGTVVPGEW
jgi:hypothetical protein